MTTDASISTEKPSENNATTNATSNTDKTNSSNTSVTADAADPFDKTSRKVIVYNVLKYIKNVELPSLVQTWIADHPNLAIEKQKKPPQSNWVQVTLKTEDMVTPFLELMNSGSLSNKRGQVYYAKKCDNENQKRGDDRDNSKSRKRKPNPGSTTEPETEYDPLKVLSDAEVLNSLVPYWDKTYEHQLIMKNRQVIQKCTKKIINSLKQVFLKRTKESKRNPEYVKPLPIYDWIQQKVKPINVHRILPSPTLREYRNKCEFTFGSNAKGEVCCGYTPNGWNGYISSSLPCPNIPAEMCGLELLFTKFVRESSFGVYHPKTHVGVWRQVTIRLSEKMEECMVIVMHAPVGRGENDGDDYDERLKEEQQRLVTLLTKGGIPLPSRVFPKALLAGNKPAPAADDEPNDADDTTGADGASKKQKLDNDTKDATNDSNVVAEETEPVMNTSANPDVENLLSSSQTSKTMVTSIYFQEFDGLSCPPPEYPVQHAYGTRTIRETLGDCTFHVSPGAFFQVNTRCAELLYGVVVDKLKDIKDTVDSSQPTDTTKEESDADTILLDVCCGTGTIGITCLKAGVADRIVGVDISQPAIEDAIQNATANGYSVAEASVHINDAKEDSDDDVVVDSKGNVVVAKDPKSSDGKAQFIASRAEKVLQKELWKLGCTQTVHNAKTSAPNYDHDSTKPPPRVLAVVDPAREGLHGDVIRTLRSTPQITRLVYVSCNPTGSLINDATLLCSPSTKRYPGCPFRITSAQPVDMFPMTKHVEMVMVFDRMSPEESLGLKVTKNDDTSEPAEVNKADTTKEISEAAESTSVTLKVDTKKEASETAEATSVTLKSEKVKPKTKKDVQRRKSTRNRKQTTS